MIDSHNRLTVGVGWLWLAEQAVHAAVYFSLARLAQLVAIPPGDISPFWPASGYALAIVLLRGDRHWLGIWLGSFLGHAWLLDNWSSISIVTVHSTVGGILAAGAVVQALLGARLVRILCGSLGPFRRVRDVLAFAVAVLLSCLIGPTVGVPTLTLSGAMAWPEFTPTWLVWYVGDATGAIVAAPLLLSWSSRERRPDWNAARTLEAASLLLFAILTAVLIFTPWSEIGRRQLPVSFLVAIPLLWVTLRFSQFLSAVLVLIVTIFVGAASLFDVGPFSVADPDMTLLLSPVFVAVAMIGVLSLSAALQERHEAEQAYREGEHRFALTLEAVSDGWWEWNVTTGELWFSDRWFDSWGYSREELEPHIRGWQQLVHPDDLPGLNQALEDHFTGAAPMYECEYRIRMKTGEYAWSLDRGKVVRFDASGSPLWMVGTDTNITDRKRAESELHATERRLQAIVDNTAAVIYVKDPQLCYLLVNRRFEELFSLTNDSIRGKDDFAIFTAELAEGFRGNDRRVLETGETLVVEELAPHQDGLHTYISVKFPLRDAASQIYAVAGISTDITDRKRSEEAMEHYAEELERTNRDLRLFAYAASHDLQEPLRAIAGYCQLLRQRYHRSLDSDADRWIDLIVDGAKRMNTLLADLLDYSRVNTQGGHFEWVDGEHAMQTALANLSAAIAETNATVTHDPLPTFRADPVQFVQLLQNLIGNAIKYCDQQPRVHVTVSRFDNEWRFSVSDNGIGIDPRHRETIFAIFTRLHTREQYAGTGIGLAICQRIVERHKGRIWVDSQPGQGSTFSFTIPVMAESEVAHAV